MVIEYELGHDLQGLFFLLIIIMYNKLIMTSHVNSSAWYAPK